MRIRPDQKGKKQLLAQYRDRLICVRYRVEPLVAERNREPPPPRFGRDQIVGLRVACADMAVRDRVKQPVARGIQSDGSGNCTTIAWSRSAPPHRRRTRIQ